MDAKTYLHQHWDMSGSIAQTYEAKIIELMENYAALKVSEKPERVIYREKNDYYSPVIGHFQEP